MSPEYQEAVIKAYQKKRDDHTLSLNLVEPQPRMIKAECEAAFEWFEKTDEATFEVFVKKKKENKEAYLTALTLVQAHRFKALNNFLHDKVDSPEPRTIEMLAFLINFKPRPYREGWKPIAIVEEEEIIIAPPVVIEDVVIEDEPITGEPGDAMTPVHPIVVVQTDGSDERENDGEGKKEKETPTGEPTRTADYRVVTKRNMVILAALVTLSIGAYKMIKVKGGDGKDEGGSSIVNRVINPKEGDGCMYWNDNHYERIACDQKQSGALIVPLDSEKLVHLKQIKDTSTISDASVGHVWYFKTLSKEIQCFTDSGMYPVDTNRRLLPITKYIIHKYFHR